MNTGDRDAYARLLEEAGRFHGDVCQGIAIGTRMTMVGLEAIGIADPKGADRKDLVVYVEIDRCATDAIMALTGCRPGKRTMKVLDYGKMAATFVNLKTGRAVRVATLAKSRDGDGNRSLERDIATMDPAELFSIMAVDVSLRPEDLPGLPVRAGRCDRCGETILDGREIEADGLTVCRPCFEGRAYYARLDAGTPR